jgi:aldose 1-epimerase
VLQPNWPGQRHPMHGDACRAPWRVEEAHVASADLVYDHAGTEGWPFRYRARQSFRLLPDRLSVEISVENTGRRAYPAGLGLHPFFSRDAETMVAFAAAHVWTADAEMIPVRQIAIPPEWDVGAPKRVDDIVVDNCFGGWDGVASVAWPARGLRLTMTAGEPFRHVVFYAPKGRPYFCVEPVSHANNAFALHEQGVDGVGFVELAPGRTLGGHVEFRLSSL